MTSHSTSERPSFEQLARELAAPLLRYLQRQVGDASTAEDLRQETLLKIERGLPSFAGRAELKTWAFAIASRVVIDHLRHGSQRLKVVEMDEAADIPDAAATLDDSLVIDEMNSCVRGVIDSLPADYRTALILHDLEGMSLAQTAAVSDCSLPTAKIRIHRARQRLKAALARECEFYRDSDSVFRCTRS
jgi:RNA polymerase sigma-70 factor (ECF subfamily)